MRANHASIFTLYSNVVNMLNLFVMMKYKLSLHHITHYCGR